MFQPISFHPHKNLDKQVPSSSCRGGIKAPGNQGFLAVKPHQDCNSGPVGSRPGLSSCVKTMVLTSCKRPVKTSIRNTCSFRSPFPLSLGKRFERHCMFSSPCEEMTVSAVLLFWALEGIQSCHYVFHLAHIQESLGRFLEVVLQNSRERP